SQFVTELIRNALKKQENSEEFDDDDSSSDDNGGRRSSLSESQPPIPYQGDDTEVDDIVREAQEMVIRDQPLPVTAINSELSRRLFNVMEKNKINQDLNHSDTKPLLKLEEKSESDGGPWGLLRNPVIRINRR
ncbi:hypothetical protein T265_16100, partial [Opisthorchis viverrini]